MSIDLTIVRGDTRTYDLSLVYADATVPDLAGATVDFIVDGLFRADASDVIVDESSGEATVTVNPTDTEDSPNRRTSYRYNVQVTTADGTVLTTQRGLFAVLPEVDNP